MISFKQFLIENDDYHWHDVYHGSPDIRGIKEGGFKTLKQRYDQDDKRPTYFFTDSHKMAHTYAKDKPAFDYQNSVPGVIRAKVNTKHFKHIHWNGRPFRGKGEDGQYYSMEDEIEKARDEGHEGVIIHRVIDSYNVNTKKPQKVYAVFHGKNIKIQ